MEKVTYLLLDDQFSGLSVSEFDTIEEALQNIDDQYYYSMRLYAVVRLPLERKTVIAAEEQ